MTTGPVSSLAVNLADAGHISCIDFCLPFPDFNFAPDDPAYSLLVGSPLSAAQSSRLQLSRVIHISIDPTVPPTAKKADDEEGDGSEADPDRVINNSRAATSSDGLLSDLELTALFTNGAKLRSAYDEGQRSQKESGLPGDVSTFGDRASLPSDRLGAHEPMWTSYTHYWKTTLGCLFLSFFSPPLAEFDLARLHLVPGNIQIPRRRCGLPQPASHN